MYYLVQRLDRKEQPTDIRNPLAPSPAECRTFDDMFECDYMGSSEFEWGAIPKAYRRMLGFDLAIRPVELTRNGVTRTVYFIATDDEQAYVNSYDSRTGHDIETFEEALEVFRTWLNQPCLRAKEPTRFDMLFEGDIPDYMREYPPRVVAWWSIDDNIAWTLDESIAQELLQAFTTKPRSAANS